MDQVCSWMLRATSKSGSEDPGYQSNELRHSSPNAFFTLLSENTDPFMLPGMNKPKKTSVGHREFTILTLPQRSTAKPLTLRRRTGKQHSSRLAGLDSADDSPVRLRIKILASLTGDSGCSNTSNSSYLTEIN